MTWTFAWTRETESGSANEAHLGSPGPFENKTPSGFNAKTSAAGIVAGTTVILHPNAARRRMMLCFTPKSYATTCSDPFFDAFAAAAHSHSSPVGSVH